MTTKTWTDERTAKLVATVGTETPVSVDTQEAAAEALETTIRSIAAKLRKMGFDVASSAKVNTPAFTPEEAEALQTFVEANAHQLTYTDIAAQFADGAFTNKQVQGKLLSMQLTGLVKPAEKVEEVRKYTADEEAKIIGMCEAGAFVEEIAEAMGRAINSIRGKALALLKAGQISKIPAQKESHAKAAAADVLEGVNVAEMTVAELVAKTGKTDRGIRTTLTRRGLSCKDHDGAAKRAKNDAKNEAKAS